ARGATARARRNHPMERDDLEAGGLDDVGADDPGMTDEKGGEELVAASADPVTANGEDAGDTSLLADREARKSLVEALLFASDEPLTFALLKKATGNMAAAELRVVLEELKVEYDASRRGVALLEVAGGYVLVTRESWAPWVERLMKGKRKVRLSRAALETVAVVAYKQPITRGEIERIRGVDAGGVLATLLERDLVMIKGRDPGPGKPLLYGSTQEFLNYFGLNKLSDLPRLDEISALAAKNPAWSDAEKARFERAGIEPIDFEGDQPPALELGAGADSDGGDGRRFGVGDDSEPETRDSGEHGLPEGLEAVDSRYFREPLEPAENDDDSTERHRGDDAEA
ncbi:MAG TPA: SMC-Scp complex subunit ScpB, partial [Candidatus Eisenbacteria bacterium]